ncbi:MAG: Pyridoxine 5'-phosphate synthase (EC [uncultured Sulfurovum sp.]|uniref:Pyridoxine 5'-phosphate synthase n=1 Tax=uncultured Sulfurovum sp. TaxID=269237 RepID=A0A6S6S2T0_9BACT|nr:MAG: Pyridoxine 5'-phosphate synthase (EC [uncultured Sulfurovum sp.]
MKLGVNIDHIAVLREARKIADPNPLDALSIVKRAGADQITIHLREDRRHIQDIDALNIIYHSSLPVNLECALASEIIDIVCELQPHRVTLVPEKREEVTTEGGLDIFSNAEELTKTIRRLKQHQIEVSLFIDPTIDNVEMSEKLGVEWIEFHTGKYANVYAMLYGNLANTHHSIKALELPRLELKEILEQEVSNLRTLSCDAKELGLKVAAGHGLNYQNVKEIADIETIEELNIGQSIIAHSIFTGLEQAIVDLKELIK